MKNNLGFTLIEMLVTLVILGIMGLGTASLMTNLARNTASADMRMEAVNTTTQVQLSLSSEAVCSVLFTGQGAKSADKYTSSQTKPASSADAISVFRIWDGINDLLCAPNAPAATAASGDCTSAMLHWMPNLGVLKMEIVNYSDTAKTAQLEIEFGPSNLSAGMTGGGIRKKSIPMLLKFADVGNPSLITGCQAVGAASMTITEVCASMGTEVGADGKCQMNIPTPASICAMMGGTLSGTNCSLPGMGDGVVMAIKGSSSNANYNPCPKGYAKMGTPAQQNSYGSDGNTYISSMGYTLCVKK